MIILNVKYLGAVLFTYSVEKNMYAVVSQFFRFACVGLVSTVITYFILIVAIEVFSVNELLSSTAGYVLGAIVNYQLNYKFTFISGQEHNRLLPKFLVVVSVGMLINAGVMHYCTTWFGFHYMLAQFVAVAVALFWSFTAARLWAFSSDS